MTQEKKSPHTEIATFAGGCFWCMEAPFEKLHGVHDVISGYSGGTGTEPSYANYASKGFTEAIQITFDPQKISYEQLLQVFWHQIDPTDPQGQFVDRGTQYQSAIFYHSQEQKEIAEKSKRELSASKVFSKPVITEIIPFKNFYKAEEYHQNYYKTHPVKYSWYRWRSGRDDFLKKTWNAPKKGNKQ